MKFVRSILIVIIISAILAIPAYSAEAAFNLPSTMVRIEVSDGTQSYFDTVLNQVPPGYDVANATYPGWCVDVKAQMTRSPATHEVFLYSSMAVPGQLANESWDLINYILNHKQGNVTDIQQAIWYFAHLDGQGGYVPSSNVAWAIISDTLQNGQGFMPGPDQIAAVICYPVTLFPNQPGVQISIIEVAIDPVIPEFPSNLVLMPIMLSATLAVLAYTRKRRIRS